MDGLGESRGPDGRGWYDDEPYGDTSNRYGSRADDRFGQPDGFNAYGDESSASSYGPAERRSHPRRGKRSGLVIPDTPGRHDDRDFGESDFGAAPYGDSGRADATLDSFDAPRYDAPQFQEPQFSEPAFPESAYGTDYADPVADESMRLTARDRQALRERATQNSSALTSGPVATPIVPAPGAIPPGIPSQAAPISGAPMSAGAPISPGVPMSPPPAALAAPTAAIPAGGSAPGSTYRSRRPGLAALLWIIAVIVELLLLKVLLGNVFHSGPAAVAGTLGSMFALAGVPMTTIGLYALATGAASTAPHPGRAWLKTPLAYLPIGLVLIVAAGLAA